jgi:Caleosin related protein
MNIDIANIQKGKHDSDTDILDQQGRFDARRFEQVFGARSIRDRNGNSAFTAIELTRVINANRETLGGFVTAMAEWQLLLVLAADTTVIVAGLTMPALSATRIMSFYDGTLFYKLARELA